MKKTLTERFQELAGIKPLYEQEDKKIAKASAVGFSAGPGPRTPLDPNLYSKSYKDPYAGPGEEEAGISRAAALLSTDDYKSVYFGDKEDFEEEGFEFIETFNPLSPYTFVMWNNEDLSVSDFDSEEEFIEEFSEMGFGGCDEEECGIAKIIEVINNASADGSNYGLALLANGEEIANGGE